MNNLAADEPKLDKPGAGLPFYEWAIAKYILLPMRFSNTTVPMAIENFAESSAQILNLLENIDAKQMSERRLVPRSRGLEDSSRFWSAAMTVEHLVIVGSGTKNIIHTLCLGKTPSKNLLIADVKPNTQVDANLIREEFRKMTDDFISTMQKLDLEKHPSVKYAHPWFGELSAKQWLIFAAPHQLIHKKQITEILRRL